MWTKIKAWYYRNYVYQDKLFEIHFDQYKPKIFELLARPENGCACIYLGNNKFVQVESMEEFFDKYVNLKNIPNL